MGGDVWPRAEAGPATGAPGASTRPFSQTSFLARHFRPLVLVLVAGYLCLQLLYITGLPLVMDEFANAGHIFRVAEGTPYRDYVPYKTVLGYFLLLPGLLGFESSWMGMLAAKAEIAVLTSIVLAAASFRLRRQFEAPAVLGSLLLLCTQSTFLERSSELRVDMLSALFGLVSLIAFMERRAVLAAVAGAVAVLVTQKGAYFALSLGGATAFQALRWRKRESLVEAARAAAAGLLVFACYIGFWCWVGNPKFVWRSMFEGPQRIAFVPLYDLAEFWWQTVDRNPVFYAVGFAGLVLLAPGRRQTADSVGERLGAYALIHVSLCIWHKQPWPYFFVMLIPTLWVVTAAGLNRQLGRGRSWSVAVGSLVAAAALASLLQRVPVVLQRSSSGQRQVVEAAEGFLQAGDTYLAGTELCWRRRHMAHLSWLDKPRLADVRKSPDDALTELREHPPRVVIDNYRVRFLPPAFHEQLRESFLSVGGNLSVYAPRVAEGTSQIHYEYGGLYRNMAPAAGRISVDGSDWLAPNEHVRLAEGPHLIRAVGGARLAAWSDDARFVQQTARPWVNLFERVYTY